MYTFPRSSNIEKRGNEYGRFYNPVTTPVCTIKKLQKGSAVSRASFYVAIRQTRNRSCSKNDSPRLA